MRSRLIRYTITSMAAMLLMTPSVACACEPVPALMYTFLGPATWGAFAAHSAWGLLIIVSLKCIFFSRWSGLKVYQSFWLMIVANLLSTVIGLIGVLMTASLSFLIFSLPILIFAFTIPSHHVAKHFSNPRFNANKVKVLFIIGTYGSTFLFYISQGFLDSNYNPWLYWLFKLGFSFLAISVGLAVSIGFEEAIICRMLKRRIPEADFLIPVTRANIYAMLIAVGTAAAIAIPLRLAAPNFLISF